VLGTEPVGLMRTKSIAMRDDERTVRAKFTSVCRELAILIDLTVLST
jgi:hypothetical protein